MVPFALVETFAEILSCFWLSLSLRKSHLALRQIDFWKME